MLVDAQFTNDFISTFYTGEIYLQVLYLNKNFVSEII